MGGIAAVAAPGAVTGAGLLASSGGKAGMGALYVLAVAAAAALGCWPAAIATAGLSYLALSYFFVEPVHQITLGGDGTLVLVAFALAALGLSLLLARERRSRAVAQEQAGRARHLAELLHDSEQQAHSVISASLDGIVVTDEDGTIELFNPACERLFGYSASEVVGKNVRALLPTADQEGDDGFLTADRRASEAEAIGAGREALGRRKDGSLFPFDLSVGETRAAGRRMFTSVVHDLTARKEHEAAREKALEREQLLAEASRLLNQSLDYEQTLSALARLSVRRLADWCMVDIVDESGEIEHLALAHRDPAKASLADELRSSLTPMSSLGAARVIQTGNSELYPRIDDDLLVRISQSGEQLEVLRRLGLTSAMVVPLAARGRVLGAISFVVTDSDRHYSDDDLRFVLELTRRAALAIDNARLHRAEREARAAAEAAVRAAARLQAVTAALASALTPEEVVAIVTREGVSALGAGAGAVFVLDPEGATFHLLGQVGYPAQLVEAWNRLSARGEGRPPDVLRQQGAVAAGSADELTKRWLSVAETMPKGSDEAKVATPVFLDGQPRGVLHFAFREARHLSGEELSFVRTLAGQCGQALERARLYRQELELRRRAERTSQRIARLQAITAALSQALTPLEVANVLLEEGRATIGASAVWVGALSDDGSQLELLAERGYPEEFVERYRTIPMTARLVAVDTVREGIARWYGSPKDFPPDYPGLWESQAATSSQALALVPLVRGDRPFGIVIFRFLEPHEFSDDDRSFLTTVVAQCSEALERARLFEREHRVAETLQRSLLPEGLPDLDGAALASRYIAGSPGLEVGGDWYDAFMFGDGWLALSVGDVVGRGVQAAASMGQLRNALRAYVREGFGPAEALGRLNQLVEGSEDRFATVILALFDSRTGFLRYSNAGHPPPLLLSRGSGARLLERGRSVPLGAIPDARYEESTLMLGPDMTLVLYTDGLVENTGVPIDEAFLRLQHAATEAPQEIEGLLEHLLAPLAVEGPRADDVALLALRPTPRAPAPLALRKPAEPSVLASIRTELRHWLSTLGLSAHEENQILVASGEACSNVIEHSASEYIDLSASVEAGAIHVVVRDVGRWQPPRAIQERGLGLQLIDSFMDGVEINTGPDGTEVRMSRTLPQEALVE